MANGKRVDLVRTIPYSCERMAQTALNFDRLNQCSRGVNRVVHRMHLLVYSRVHWGS